MFDAMPICEMMGVLHVPSVDRCVDCHSQSSCIIAREIILPDLVLNAKNLNRLIFPMFVC